MDGCVRYDAQYARAVASAVWRRVKAGAECVGVPELRGAFRRGGSRVPELRGAFRRGGSRCEVQHLAAPYKAPAARRVCAGA
eukprot:365023-Chlamydomonas_euryale.AAC.16